jgi:hypothetical protein
MKIFFWSNYEKGVVTVYNRTVLKNGSCCTLRMKTNVSGLNASLLVPRWSSLSPMEATIKNMDSVVT